MEGYAIPTCTRLEVRHVNDFPSSSEDEVQVEPDDGHQELSPHGGPKDLGSTSSSKKVKKRVS